MAKKTNALRNVLLLGGAAVLATEAIKSTENNRSANLPNTAKSKGDKGDKGDPGERGATGLPGKDGESGAGGGYEFLRIAGEIHLETFLELGEIAEKKIHVFVNAYSETEQMLGANVNIVNVNELTEDITVVICYNRNYNMNKLSFPEEMEFYPGFLPEGRSVVGLGPDNGFYCANGVINIKKKDGFWHF